RAASYTSDSLCSPLCVATPSTRLAPRTVPAAPGCFSERFAPFPLAAQHSSFGKRSMQNVWRLSLSATHCPPRGLLFSPTSPSPRFVRRCPLGPAPARRCPLALRQDLQPLSLPP